jgi:hypothetical protein
MARKALLDTQYIFTPSTRTIIIPRAVPRERLVLITDVTVNKVIYNFSDSSLTASSYTIAPDPTNATTSTTIVLSYNTSALTSTDKLQIIIDEYDEKFTPSETYLDAVNKLRVSQPQSLIDTDYEYSTQQTKWENLAMVNNQPYAWYNVSNVLPISALTATQYSRTYTATPVGVPLPSVGSPVVVIDSNYAGADGVYIVDSVTTTTFSYTGKFYFTGSSGSIYNNGATTLYYGGVYSTFSALSNQLASISYSGTQVTITTNANFPHGMVPGNEIAVTGVTTSGSNPPNGSWVVATASTPLILQTYVNTAPTGTLGITASLTGAIIVLNATGVGVATTTGAAAGQVVIGNGIPVNTYIATVNSGTGFTSTISSSTLTVTGTVTGSIANGSILANGGVTANTYILTQLTSTSSTAATGTFFTGGTINQNLVSVVQASGTITVGQIVSGTNISAGSYVSSVTTSTISNSTVVNITLTNYLGQASNFTGQSSGTLNFYTAGNIGTYQLNTSIATGTPTAATGLTLTNVATTTATGVTLTVNAVVFPRPGGTLVHRPADGGCRFSTNAASHNHQFIRQTRRYFRYQSGKAIQMSTGTTLKPQMNIDGITSSGLTVGSTISINTKDPHNIVSGVTIQITNADQLGFNGQFVVQNVITPYQFTVLSTQTLTSTTVSGTPVGSVVNWYGNTNRVGLFDSQNGMYFEYDGQQLWVVRRHSIYQIAGTIAVNASSQLVTGTGTSFSKQLHTNDFIVIRGMTYRVHLINSDTSLTIMPGFRGTTNITGALASKTIDVRVPQTAWNLDKCDGTGPSGFNLDVSRMQMFYIDYSWYGSGFIRFGLRGADGNIIYVHRIANNNVNFLSYMRSGNLPGRYESNTFSRYTILTSTLNSADSVINVANTYTWPTSGSVKVRANSVIEYLGYTGISATATGTFIVTTGSNVLTSTTGSVTGITVGQYVSGFGFNYADLVTVQLVGASTITVSKPSYGNNAGNVTAQTYLFNPILTGVTRGQAGNTGGTLTGTTTAGSNTITAVSSITGLQIGQYVFSTTAGYIPPQSYITAIGTTTVTITQAATQAGTITLLVAPLGSTAQTFTYSATAQTVVELHAPQFASEISHWGTSAIMDGQFTNDKNFVFTKGMLAPISVSAGATQPIMSIRVAPSASNGIPALTVGIREIITRMQLVLSQADILSNGNFLITLRLNGITYDGNQVWNNVGGSSMAQFIFHSNNAVVSSGEVIFGFYLNVNAGSYASTSQDLSQCKDLGTSVLSGGFPVISTGVYPDGPDVVTITATNVGSSSANIQARLSWIEAQA